MKRFYNNKLMRFAPKGALRYIALLCVLMGVSVSAWAVTIPGSFNGWSTGAIIDNPYEIHLDAGDHYFKIESGTVWWGLSGGKMTRNDCTGYVLYKDNENCTISADVAGTYIFTLVGWDNGNPKISVTYPPTEAQAGFNDNNALKLKINGTEKSFNKTGAATWNIGTNLTSAPKLTEATINIWKKLNQGNFCGATLCASFDDTNKDLASFTWNSSNPDNASGTGTNVDQVWKYTGNIELPSTPGNHTVKFWVKANAVEHGKNCGSNYIYLNNGSSNYTITYSIAAVNVTNVYGVGTAFSGWPSNDCDNTKFIALTSDANNIFSAELTGLAGTTSNNQFKFTTKQCWTNCATSGCNTTLQFYEACSPDANKMYGVAVNKDNDDNSIVTLSSGYTTPATLYVDKTKNTYWIEATKEGASSGEYFYCDMTSKKDWHQNNTSTIRVKFTKTDSSTEYQFLEQCTSNTDVYVSAEIDLSTISKAKVMRYDASKGDHSRIESEGDSYANNQIERELKDGNNCIKVTDWQAGEATKFTGNCGGTGPIDTDTPLLLTYDPRVDLDNNTAVLSAYLRYTMCEEMTEYGFVYCVSPNKGGCTPTASSALKITQKGELQRGQEYSLTTPRLPDNNWYTYRAYAIIGGVTYVSDEYRDFTFNTCTQPEAGTDGLTFTVDASLGESYSDPCTLTFGTIELAIKFLKDSYKSDAAYQYVTKDNNGSYNLNQNVIMNVRFYDDTPDDNTTAYVYKGSTWTSSAGTDKMPDGKGLALMVEDINKASSATKTLTIKGENPLLTPHVHHMLIRNSRNIILDNLHFVSDPEEEVQDNAFEIDVNSTAWNSIAIATRANANILVQNCSFNAKGFTGIHVSGYDGITFVNNIFNAAFETEGYSDDEINNSINYGASAKFIACKNIKFVQNNFTGDHATMVWIQESQNMLFMNNVFWNTNKFLQKEGTHTPAAIRLVSQFGKNLQNLGFYYNTFYFALNETVSDSRYDFLSFSRTINTGDGTVDHIKYTTMAFKYNNCYSYDTDCPGRNDDPFLGKLTSINASENFCPNNFWSKNDNANFAFGCTSNKTINVSDQMCGTTALDPSMLVINGNGLNFGAKLTVAGVQTVVGDGISLTDDEVTSDRYNNAIRPDGGNWTYGAYQQKESNEVDEIVWQGDENENWDDRNNWVYLDKDNKPQPLTCLQILSDDLKVIIPEGNSSTYPTPSEGITYWPQLPSSFKADKRAERGIPANEQVNTATTNKYAKTIQLEYGAALKGVEYLKVGEDRFYENAIVGFSAPRTKNILVGTVIKPWDEETQQYRNLKSGDYYIANHLPHVYMRRAKMVGANAADWDEAFTSLGVEVNPDRVFVIYVSNQYGEYKHSADTYNKKNKTNYSATEPHQYPDIEGIFADEEGTRTYNVVDGNRLFNNSYPCNLDASMVGNVSVYSYANASFSPAESGDIIKPQHGFILNEQAGSTLTINPNTMLTGGDTKSRSAVATLPKFYLHAINATSGEEQQSKIIVKYDAAHDGLAPASMDASKVFSVSNTNTPELYMLAYDNKYARLHTHKPIQTIPLGIMLQVDMRVHFKLSDVDGFEKVTLYDAVADKEFNLTESPDLYLDLKAGNKDYVGQYFLNVTLQEETDDNIDDDTTTDIEEEVAGQTAINIYTNGDEKSVQIVTNGVELQQIYVSDMTGRTMRYDAEGTIATIQLPVVDGIYLVQVIGDNATRTEKVVIK